MTSTNSALFTQTDTTYYTWANYRCAYQVYNPVNVTKVNQPPLLLIHPIGVGLSGWFWQRFCQEWYQQNYSNSIYNPDLMGCGKSDFPHVAYTADDWADQLVYLIENIIKKPVILVVQGALFPVAISLVKKIPNMIKGLVLSGPPAWGIMTKATPKWKQKLRWNILFDSLIGNGFYRYARTEKFLTSFSKKRLFGDAEKIDQEWLDNLQLGASDIKSRHAVYAFLAGFWRDNYQQEITSISQPTLVVFGETASSISKDGREETADQRLAQYLAHLPKGEGLKIPGRNVLPYESTKEFVRAIGPFITKLN